MAVSQISVVVLCLLPVDINDQGRGHTTIVPTAFLFASSRGMTVSHGFFVFLQGTTPAQDEAT